MKCPTWTWVMAGLFFPHCFKELRFFYTRTMMWKCAIFFIENLYGNFRNMMIRWLYYANHWIWTTLIYDQCVHFSHFKYYVLLYFNMFLTLLWIICNFYPFCPFFHLLRPNFQSARYAKFIEVIIIYYIYMLIMVEISKLENVKYTLCTRFASKYILYNVKILMKWQWVLNKFQVN